MPAERTADFADIYARKLAPILEAHGLVEGQLPSRAAVDGVFSRLFEVATPGEIPERERALAQDPAWTRRLGELAGACAPGHPQVPLPFSLRPFSTTAIQGTATQIGPGYRHGLWHSFGVQDGLPDSMVYDTVRDRSGNLWFATSGGVSRFDGAQFTTFTTADGLTDNRVEAACEDGDGNLWFGTYGGVSRFDGSEFSTFTTEDGLAHDLVHAVQSDRNGDLWFGTLGGLSRFDGDEFSAFPLDCGRVNAFARHARFSADDVTADPGRHRVLSIGEDRDGNLWFGTREGVSRFDGVELTTFTEEEGLAGTWVRAIHQDEDGDLWFGLEYGGGVSRFDGRAFTTFTVDDGLPSNQVIAIAGDRDGRLWFGTFSHGVCRYDGWGFAGFSIEHGLANNQVLSIGEDGEGNLWLGTKGSGVTRYAGAQFTNLTTRDGLAHDAVLSMLRDRRGDLWFGTSECVSRYDGESFTTYGAADGLVGEGVDVIFEDSSDRLWFGTMEGISLFDGRESAVFTIDDGLATDALWTMLEDRSGNLWFGGAGRRIGVTCFDGRQFIRLSTAEGLVHNSVLSILEDRDGNLWFATEGGVSRYDGRGFLNYTVRDGLPRNELTSIMEDGAGDLWFGSIGGLSRYDGEQFTTFTTDDGLAHNNVECMLEDRRGRLWFGTFGGGVVLHDGLVFQSLTRQDGLVHDTVQQLLEDPDGCVWIATEGGVTRYEPRTTPPTVRITSVIADRRYAAVPEIQIPASQKVVVFEFLGGSFSTRLDGMAYAYRLTGFDTEWQTTVGRRVEYQDVPLGEYTFEVKAVDRDLNYSEPASVEVVVLADPRIEALNQALGVSGGVGEFVGKSPALRRVLDQLAEVAAAQVTVCISGETGTGKGLGARTLHGLGPRAASPFIQVNCGAIPASLVESELFGHERGAFTGAVARKLGKVELADGGTLFLDEIGDLPLDAQAKLLRLLDEHAFERVGGTRTVRPDVRIIAASNRDLRRMVTDGQFRADLYYRLRAFPVRLPSLRERREDIPILAAHFAERMAGHLSKRVTGFAPEALTALQAYSWPGNVRELEHSVQRAVIVCRQPEIQARDISLGLHDDDEGSGEELVTLDDVDRHHILRTLEQMGWVIGGPQGAAAVLGLNESTLRGRMRKLGIKRP